jgi:hypothetical protein
MGWIDGDGNYYNKGSCIQFGLSGTHEQDWSSFERLCKINNIKYSIQRLIRKNGNKHSTFRIIGMKQIKKLYEAIYLNSIFVGLKYKYKTVTDIYNRVDLRASKLNIVSNT